MSLFRSFVVIVVISMSGLTACGGNRIARSADVSAAITVVSSSEPVQVAPTPSSTPTTPPPTPTATPSPTPTPTLSLTEMLLAEARHSQGAEDAPVTFIEFSDFK